MKKYCLYMMMMFVSICTITSCGDEEDNSAEEAWKTANEQAFSAIKTNSEYTELKSPSNEGSIYYKVLTKGTGTKPIYYTSTATCYFKGWFAADYSKYDIKKGDIFSQALFDDGVPSSFKPSGTITGFKTALQNMVEGDKWEIWIPYQLGYGTTDQYDNDEISIPAYSTLVYEIEIVSVTGAEE